MVLILMILMRCSCYSIIIQYLFVYSCIGHTIVLTSLRCSFDALSLRFVVMAAVSTNNRLCQGIRMLVPGVRPSSSSSAGHRQTVVREVGSQRDVDGNVGNVGNVGNIDVPASNVNSIAAQLSILRLSSPVSSISGFRFSSSLAAAAFHSSASDDSARLLERYKKSF